jgi:enoyl-CoA hydratase
MGYETLRIDKDGAVDWVTLHRPERINALDSRMVEELSDYFGARYADPQVRIVVLRGAGRGFCSGLDLKQSAAELRPDPALGMFVQRRFSEIVLRMRRCSQPIVALLHGPAIGAGFSLALAADVRLAGQSARMSAAFIRVGFSGGDCGSSYHLPRIVGGSVAAELLLTGREIGAERALAVGLVSEVVPDERLEAAGRALVSEMVSTAPLGLRLTKDLLNASLAGCSLEQAIALEDRSQILCVANGDPAEGIRAFNARRPPVFRG